MIILNYFPARQKELPMLPATAVDISRYRTGKRTLTGTSPQLKKTGFRTCETCWV